MSEISQQRVNFAVVLLPHDISFAFTHSLLVCSLLYLMVKFGFIFFIEKGFHFLFVSVIMLFDDFRYLVHFLDYEIIQNLYTFVVG